MNCEICGRNIPGRMVLLGNEVYCIICYYKIPFSEKKKIICGEW